jgi:hypothetical protein
MMMSRLPVLWNEDKSNFTVLGKGDIMDNERTANVKC